MTTRRTLTPTLLATSLVLTATLTGAPAQAGSSLERAEVLAADPVYRTISYSVPTEQCRLIEEPVRSEPRYRSFTGPILGAVIGGAIGNAVGHSKTNKKVGTAVGAVVGGTIGRDIQRRAEADRYERQSVRWETREVCETVYETHEREELDGYDVTYRYAGVTQTTRLDYDPGRYLKVRVRVTPV